MANTPFTNTPGTGLDANGALLDGWKYVTYNNGVGQGTPVYVGAANPAADFYRLPTGPQAAPAPTTTTVGPVSSSVGTNPPSGTTVGQTTGLINTASGIGNTSAASSSMTPGNIQTAMNATDPRWDVTPDQLVENRVKGMLDDNNPLMQQAKTQGLISAQERGLLNTSMGVEAGQKALYDYAVPIATVDSQTLGNAGRTNAENAVAMSGQRTSLAASLAGTNASMANAALSAQTQKDVAAAQMNFNSLQNVSEGVRYGWGTLQSGINQVLSSSMTPAAKDAAVRDMTSQYLAYANTVSSIYQIDLSPLLSQWMPRTA